MQQRSRAFGHAAVAATVLTLLACAAPPRTVAQAAPSKGSSARATPVRMVAPAAICQPVKRVPCQSHSTVAPTRAAPICVASRLWASLACTCSVAACASPPAARCAGTD